MKLYCTPGGTWAGNEKDWKDAMKDEGLDPKAATRKIVEVPVSKAELMEWLTFHNVNPIAPRALSAQPAIAPPVSNPTPPAPAAGGHPIPQGSALDDAFAAAPLGQQLDLASIAVSNARERLVGVR